MAPSFVFPKTNGATRHPRLQCLGMHTEQRAFCKKMVGSKLAKGDPFLGGEDSGLKGRRKSQLLLLSYNGSCS